MTEARVVLTGIHARGRHGVDEQERERPQEFVVDLEVLVEAGEDSIEATADYREVSRVARETVEQESFQLLETLADAVARAVAAIDGVRTVRVVVHKPAAASSLGVDDVRAEATTG